MPNIDFSNLGMYTGTAKTAKYMYQSGRAIQGLGTTTKMTAAVDLLAGGVGVNSGMVSEAMGSAAKGIATTSKGVVGAAKVSKFAQVAGYASKAAPVVAKASCVLGAAVGGYQIGTGVCNYRAGNKAKGKEQMISGTADVVTAGALAVAATSAGTVVGLPVAGVALGVAAGAQAVKYGYRYRHKIAKGAKSVGNGVVNGAKYVGNGVTGTAKAVGKGINKSYNWTADKASTGWNKAKNLAGKIGGNMAKAYGSGLCMPYGAF